MSARTRLRSWAEAETIHQRIIRGSILLAVHLFIFLAAIGFIRTIPTIAESSALTMLVLAAAAATVFIPFAYLFGVGSR